MGFGDIIKKARKDRFSQQSLGKQIGVWGTYIGQIEKGERIPSDERCLQLAKALDLDSKTLLIEAYRERADGEARRLFDQMSKLLADPTISRLLANRKILDASVLSALEHPGIRKLLKNPEWRDALLEATSVPDRQIPQLIHIIKQMSAQQWEALLGTAKAMAGIP